jgi:2-methylisocitrate lyase-like PEP mutase family enzyme
MSSDQAAEPPIIAAADLEGRCERLRSLHVPGNPLLLPNAWDVASAKAVQAAGFPVVATTSAGVAATLGYEDHEAAPGEQMLAAAARICRVLDLPVTVDAEAGYGMEPAQLVSALRGVGAAGCNLEDTDHGSGALKDAAEHAAWLRAVREAASDQGYGLVINARIDLFLTAFHSGDERPQGDLLPEAVERAGAYLEAGADCVFPIALWEADPLTRFIAQAGGPVNVLAIPSAPSLPELAELGAARISYGGSLHSRAMEQFGGFLAELRDELRRD